jgi:hypothetical protein
LLTLAIIFFKLILGIYLSVKVRKSKKEEKGIPLFIAAVMLLMFLWAISRTFFMLFDFFFTKFVELDYPKFPNVWFWKFGSLFGAIGVVAILFIVDKKILSNKFKGIFAYIMLSSTVIMMIFPVYTYPDFVMVSTIGFIGSATSLLVPILFLYIGIKTPGLRKTAFIFTFGILIYVVGSAFVSASIIPIFYSAGLTQTMVYAISTSMKVLGLSMMTYGTTRFHF